MSQLGRINLKLWQETVKVNDLSDIWYQLTNKMMYVRYKTSPFYHELILRMEEV